jgi:hypothetical protein
MLLQSTSITTRPIDPRVPAQISVKACHHLRSIKGAGVTTLAADIDH